MDVMQDHNGEWHFQDPLKGVSLRIDDTLDGVNCYVADMMDVTSSNNDIYFDHNGRILSNEELGIDNDPNYLQDYQNRKWVLLRHGDNNWVKHEIAKTPQRRDHG